MTCNTGCKVELGYTDAIEKRTQAIKQNEEMVEHLNAMNERLSNVQQLNRLRRAKELAALEARRQAEVEYKIKLGDVNAEHLQQVRQLNDQLVKNVDSLILSISEINETLEHPAQLFPSTVFENAEKFKDYVKLVSDDKREFILPYDMIDYIFEEKDNNYKSALETLVESISDVCEKTKENKQNIDKLVQSTIDLVKSNQVAKTAQDTTIQEVVQRLVSLEETTANDNKEIVKVVNKVANLVEKLELRVSALED